MEVGEHFRVVFDDNTAMDGVLSGANPAFLKFLSLEDGRMFYVPLRKIKRLESWDEGHDEDDDDDGDDDDDIEPDPEPSIGQHFGGDDGRAV